MNIIDKCIEFISPMLASKREMAKLRLKTYKLLNSGYSEGGASRQKNAFKKWTAQSKSVQEDNDKNIPILRQRARSLYMTAPLAVSAIKTNRTNVVGTGLKPKPKINYEELGLTVEQARKWQKKTEREFELWAESEHCDSTKVNDFYELQQVVCMSWLMNGDACVLINFNDEPNYMPYSLRLHVIEADRVCTPKSTGNSVDLNIKAENGNRIYNGVEINKNGAVTAYYICNTYPNSTLETKKEWIRVEAFGKKTGIPNVLMIFESERAEQYRGVPYLSPVIESLKQLTRYSEAELTAAVINGFFTVFIKTESSAEDIPFSGISDDTEDTYSNDYVLAPGAINVLRPNEDIKIADSNRPNINFDGFVSSMAKYIGASLEMPQEVLLKSFNSNYSASRAALLEAYKGYKMRREWIVKDFCQPVYELWLTEAISKGRINAPGFFTNSILKKAWCKCEWNGPAMSQIDPDKEVEAARKRVELGISTREKETIELTGGDFDVNIERLKRENELINDLISKKE